MNEDKETKVFHTANAAWEFQRNNPEWADSDLTSVFGGWQIERTRKQEAGHE